MAKYSSKDLTITYGGTDMTQHVRSINGVDIEAILEESHSFGDTWFESLSTGMKRMNPIELGGLYDDTATTGPDAKFGPTALGTSASLVITWGGTKTTTVTAFVAKYSRGAQLGALTNYSVTLQPSGTVTEA